MLQASCTSSASAKGRTWAADCSNPKLWPELAEQFDDLDSEAEE